MNKRVITLLIFLLVFIMCGGMFTVLALSPNPDADPEEFEKHAKEFWDKEQEYQESQKPENKNDGNIFTKYWWAFAAGGVVLATGGTCGVVSAVRKKKNQSVDDDRQESSPDIQDTIIIGNALHIGSRDSQQDCFIISDVSNTGLREQKGILGVVADGMGGMADGAEASAIVSRTMLQYFNEVPSSGRPELDLLNMVNIANDNVCRYMTDRDPGGSTVVAVIIQDDYFHWITVGDSRIYLTRNGAIKQINREHIYAVELDERAARGEISWESAAGDSKRAALTSYLGMGELEKIDRNIHPVQLVDGDRVLLLSDGVFDTLTDNEILDTMSLSPQESAELLKEMTLAKQNPNQDNLAIVILEYRSVTK